MSTLSLTLQVARVKALVWRLLAEWALTCLVRRTVDSLAPAG